jgi:hypothetical protein
MVAYQFGRFLELDGVKEQRLPLGFKFVSKIPPKSKRETKWMIY